MLGIHVVIDFQNNMNQILKSIFVNIEKFACFQKYFIIYFPKLTFMACKILASGIVVVFLTTNIWDKKLYQQKNLILIFLIFFVLQKQSQQKYPLWSRRTMMMEDTMGTSSCRYHDQFGDHLQSHHPCKRKENSY